MKKVICLIVLAIGFIITPFALFAAGQEMEMPEFNALNFFATDGLIAGTVYLLVQFFKKWIFKETPIVLSAILALIISVIGWVFQLGIFDGYAWWWILVNALGATLLSNGIKDWYKYYLILRGVVPKKKQ